MLKITEGLVYQEQPYVSCRGYSSTLKAPSINNDHATYLIQNLDLLNDCYVSTDQGYPDADEIESSDVLEHYQLRACMKKERKKEREEEKTRRNNRREYPLNKTLPLKPLPPS